MLDLLRKSIYAAVGLAMVTREAAEEIGRKIAMEAKMSEIEGKKFIDELIKRTDEARSSLEKLVNEKIESTLKKLNIPSRTELEDIKCRLSKLEKQENK
ncbi:MAG TPA: phasin family protein [Chitinispirillaceae bacterium]|nr:phasin family protein [Chitinispirillaceae bacterium]